MKETVEKDVRLVKRLSYVMVGFIALMLLAMVWWTYQVSIADLPLVQTLPTVVLAVVLWGIAMFASVWVDRIKRDLLDWIGCSIAGSIDPASKPIRAIDALMGGPKQAGVFGAPLRTAGVVDILLDYVRKLARNGKVMATGVLILHGIFFTIT